jgi:Skp family chaperone for outer membrane proteins
MKNKAALIAVLLLSSAPLLAIELSLEENRGERGSVGYVDMQRLFTSSPDAQRAKDSFEALVRQAEERVNLRKAELLKLRQELDAARVERDALAQSMTMAPAPSTATAPAPVPATPAVPTTPVLVPATQVSISTAASAVSASTSTVPAAVSAPALSPAAAALLGTPNAIGVSTSAAVVFSTAPAHAPRRALALPGMSSMIPAPPASPAAATPGLAAATPTPIAAAPAATVAASTRTAPTAAIPVVSSTAAAAAAAMFPAPAPAPVVAQAPAGPSPVQRLLEFDAKIISIQADIAHKETELTHEHDDADHGLLDVESRKTDQVLARLYRAVSEVARREGVSVVIDKTAILYGHQAVDLTDKVLKYLQENAAP